VTFPNTPIVAGTSATQSSTDDDTHQEQR
jgi:hypothetical protein